ncbi:hypothetical protein FRIG_07175 [Frigoribacterium faeni]|uniref:type ISP restriction/modification enzyme n=2 Tax=Bacillati TaxID=1783272 RepID=UPI001FAD8695|nr:type ISP restriction/modification enzyme [Frigoribacterium faeni]MCJ0700912.1 hypothetical protein [Frigoribacterium faeni]
MPSIIDYLQNAGTSLQSFTDLLVNGLDWPIPNGMQWDDLPIDWSLESLDLEPTKIGPVVVHQLNVVTGQDVGILVLQFDGERLPVAAVRRIIDKFLKTPGGKTRSGKRPAWNDERILVFAISPADRSVHAIGVGHDNGRRALRSLSWSTTSTPARLELIAKRGVPELKWGDRGPALATGLSATAGFGKYRGAIQSAAALAGRMAEVAKDLRDEVLDLLDVETVSGPMRSLLTVFQGRLMPDLSPRKFADVYAQTMVYGLLSARVTHPDLFAGNAPLLGITFSNELLDSIYARFREQTASEIDVDELGLGELAAELGKTDVEQILADFGSKDRRMDPVVYLYEEFLKLYDPQQRMEAGAFYTPLPVVGFMTNAVDYLLKRDFGLPLGLADGGTWADVCRHLGIKLPDDTLPDRQFVSMIDPATGTGTYLLEWLRVARESYVAANGAKGWPEHFEQVVAPAMHAFEYSVAPYSVAHLKLAVEGHSMGIDDFEPTILLTDTLSHPPLIVDTLFSDESDDPIAVEARKADTLKTRERFTVVIGNPPYSRGSAEGSGGIVVHGVPGISPLLQAMTKPMSSAGQGGHIKNLYNDYVYFWRWATWRATQELGEGPGIVSFITASSYLSGKSMSGLRAHLRDVFDDFYVVDLGGEGRGANKEENVFDILTPVAIGIGVRRTGIRSQMVSSECAIHYVRVSGTRTDKFDWLDRAFGEVDFTDVAGHYLDSLAPAAGGVYGQWPSIEDLMPWSKGGSQAKRTWPIGSSEAVVRARWEALLSSEDRGKALHEASDLTIKSTPVGLHERKPLLPIAKLERKDLPEALTRYGYRSFDRQWVVADPRVLTYPKRELWRMRGKLQIFLTTLTSTALGQGPVLTATPYVPDLHHFRGSYGGKDIFPMWTDVGAQEANLAPSLLHTLTCTLGEGIGPNEFVQYLYGLGGTAAFGERFTDELALAAGPVRLPITKDRALFDRVAGLGKELLAWHTWGERYTDVPLLDGEATEVIKISGRPETFGYDAKNQTLTVGTGKITPVSPEVWDFEVSGLKPLQKWLGYRKAQRAGRTSSPLDVIDYGEWTFTDELLLVIKVLQHTVDLAPSAAALLSQVLSSEIFTAEELS